MKSTSEELLLYDDISKLGQLLWAKSLDVRGLTTDPRMYSVMLFKRLWSNHRGYTLLHNQQFRLEADIILRSGIEAAICIAANHKMRDEFVELMRRDAAHTLQGQIKIHREEGATELVSEAEAHLRMLQAGMRLGTKAAKLDWKNLAEQGGVLQLYGFHRMLSGVSSHVTGLSMLADVAFVDEDDKSPKPQEELRALMKKMHPMMMAGATLQGALLHAGMIDASDLVQSAHTLVGRMNAVSQNWSGVDD